jgi:hypothetical protein
VGAARSVSRGRGEFVKVRHLYNTALISCNVVIRG